MLNGELCRESWSRLLRLCGCRRGGDKVPLATGLDHSRSYIPSTDHPSGWVRAHIISGGSTGRVELLPSGYVRKAVPPDLPHAQLAHDSLAQEHRIYKLLGPHPRLLQLIDYSEADGLVLEYMAYGTLRDCLRAPSARVTDQHRASWILDMVEGLGFLHSHGIIHGDVNPDNFLLDSSSRLRIIDFAGSTTPDKAGTAREGARFCLPRDWDSPSTVLSDLFALGSTVYEVTTGTKPYEELGDDSEVESLFANGTFPATEHFVFGNIIRQCWESNLRSVMEVLPLLNEICQSRSIPIASSVGDN